jgi:hypothetical protein
MGQVIVLAKYRSVKKRSYFKKYEAQINKFVKHFIQRNIRCSFESISQQYIASKQAEQETAWDYYDLRDTLKDAIFEVFGEQIYLECNTLYWFDSRYLSRDDLVENCMSQMILGTDVSAQR